LRVISNTRAGDVEDLVRVLSAQGVAQRGAHLLAFSLISMSMKSMTMIRDVTSRS